MRTSLLVCVSSSLPFLVGGCHRAPSVAPAACICPAPIAPIAPIAAVPAPAAATPAVAALAEETPRPRWSRTFALSILGDEANEDKRTRCRQQVRAMGAHLDDRATVRVRLMLSAQNRLRIRSTSRGVVFTERLGRDPVFDLRTEVTARALRALAHEPARS